MACTDFRKGTSLERRAVNQAKDSSRHRERVAEQAQQPREETWYNKAPVTGAGVGSTMGVERQQNEAQPSIRTCQSCAHYVGELGPHGGKCTVGRITSPIDGMTYGGQPSQPRHWQPAIELRTAAGRFTSCGQRGEQWEAIF